MTDTESILAAELSGEARRSFDMRVAFVVGFAAGMCGIVPLVHLDLVPIIIAIFLPAALSLLAAFGIYVAHKACHIVPASLYVARFLVVGGASTLLELGVLNILFIVTGLTYGVAFSVFKTFTYLLGFCNSYFLNTRWTFEKPYAFHGSEFAKFSASNAFALALNVGVASFIVNGIESLEGISSAAWANIGSVVAVFIVLVWNFLSYKYIVFKT